MLREPSETEQKKGKGRRGR
jgi:hypothetical protein